MKRISKIIGVITLVTIAVALVADTTSAQMMAKNDRMMMAPAKEKTSLYQRLGGYDALAAVTDDFLVRLISDQQFARFFGGASDDSKKRLRQHVIDFFCVGTGGPCAYTGRDMKTAHKGLGITEADWNAAVKHFVETLDKFNVQGKDREDLIAVVAPLKEQIVEKN